MRLALYRECRPARFAEIVGQDHVTRTLRNAVTGGRLAHAYLFCGPRGTGKTSTARVLAKALNCPHVRDGEPCGECPVCTGIAQGEGVDVVEMDAASNRGIDEIRSLRERVRLAPVGGRYKVYVIDEVHMLTTEAFNALLKTLEEPPRNVVFILCTTEVYRVPATIISRCQRFDFRPLGNELIARYLSALAGRRGLKVEETAAKFIARVSSGSVRDALSVLDQCLAYSSEEVTLAGARRVVGALDGELLVRMVAAMISGDAAGIWKSLDDLLADGRNPRDVARGVAAHLRDLLLFRLAGRSAELIGPGADDENALKEQAAAASEGFLYSAIDALTSVDSEMRYAPQPRLALEARLLRLCALSSPDAVPAAKPAADSPGRPQAGTGPAGRTPRSSGPAVRPKPASPSPSPEEAAAPQPERAAGPKQEAAGQRESRRADPQRPDHAHEPPPEGNLTAVWEEVMRELPVPTSGLLVGSNLSWESGWAWVSVPAGRDLVAEHLSSGGHLRAISESLSSRLGRRVEVRIRLQGVTEGLFAAEQTTAVAAGTRKAASSTPQNHSGRTTAPRQGRGRSKADLARQAEAMFAAEEVDKGDEQEDEPW